MSDNEIPFEALLRHFIQQRDMATDTDAGMMCSAYNLMAPLLEVARLADLSTGYYAVNGEVVMDSLKAAVEELRVAMLKEKQRVQ